MAWLQNAASTRFELLSSLHIARASNHCHGVHRSLVGVHRVPVLLSAEGTVVPDIPFECYHGVYI